jgi:hypothetical protein
MLARERERCIKVQKTTRESVSSSDNIYMVCMSYVLERVAHY